MFQGPKTQILVIFISTCLAGFSLGSIISFTDPTTSSWITFSFFYLSLFLVALGLFTIIGVTIRQTLLSGVYIIHVRHSFRQALFLALLIIISLLLQSKGLLYWWVEASIILFFASLEAFLNLNI